MSGRIRVVTECRFSRDTVIPIGLMELGEFTATYARVGNDELLCLWADRHTLVPEAVIALDSEVQKRGLKKEDASRIKSRIGVLAARESKSQARKQVLSAKYEHNMRRFTGWKEPDFYSPYGSRDIRTAFAHLRHKYRAWEAFREHTGHWPLFSIWFHFLSWMALLGLFVFAFVRIPTRIWDNGWSTVAFLVCFLLLIGVRELGARLMRKLDWKRYGP